VDECGVGDLEVWVHLLLQSFYAIIHPNVTLCKDTDYFHF
jgi:hypothetical protein